MRTLLLPLLALLSIPILAQNLPKMKLIEGGTRTLGGGYQYTVKHYYMVLLGGDEDFAELNRDQIVIGEVPRENNPNRRVTVSSFYIAETEVSNDQYRTFLVESLLTPTEKAAFQKQLKAALKDSVQVQRAAWQPLFVKAAAAGLLPDSTCWTNDFKYAYNDPLAKHYHWHTAFADYPVVGVSWNQATAYCNWLTGHVNADSVAHGKPELPEYRLPTEMEWEFAAKGRLIDNTELKLGSNYPWEDNALTSARGDYRANIKTDHGDYIGDGYGYTAPVRSFEPNSFGLYNMAGNASEWCQDVFRFNKLPTTGEDMNPARRPAGQLFEEAAPAEEASEQRVVKGGSWADYRYAARIGSRTGFTQDQGFSRVGFRVAQIKVGRVE